MLRRSFSRRFLWGQSRPNFELLDSILPPHATGNFIFGSAAAAAGAASSSTSVEPTTTKIHIMDVSEAQHRPHLVRAATADQVTQAIAAASHWKKRRQQHHPSQSASSCAERVDRFANLIALNLDTIARAESLNTGLPIADSLACVERSVDWLKFCAAWRRDDKMQKRLSAAAAATTTVTVVDEPLGIVAVITPFEHSFATAMMHIGAALAAGNSVIWKPSIDAALSSVVVGNLLFGSGAHSGISHSKHDECGFPLVPLQIVQGVDFSLASSISASSSPPAAAAFGSAFSFSVVDRLASSPHIHAVVFTGSAKMAGSCIKVAAGASNMKRCFCYTQDSACIVLADANRVDSAVACAMNAFRHSGQNPLVSPRRMLVRDDLLDPFLESLLARVAPSSSTSSSSSSSSSSLWKSGHSLDAAVDQGPVRDWMTKTQFLEAVVRATTHAPKDSRSSGGAESANRDSAADLVFGGFSPKFPGGHFLAPTCLCNVAEGTELWREWLPGPLLCVNTFRQSDTGAELAARINSTSRFGGKAFVYCADRQDDSSSSSSFSSSTFREELVSHLDVGSVFVNKEVAKGKNSIATPLDDFEHAQQPRKISGDGAILGGVECIEQYLRRKTIFA